MTSVGQSMTLNERIGALAALGASLDEPQVGEMLSAVISNASQHNPWFTPQHIIRSIKAIQNAFLNETLLRQFRAAYPHPDPVRPQIVGLVMAGNIPLVGFHDLLCTFLAGHISQVKLSEKDSILLPFLLDRLTGIDGRASSYFRLTNRLSEFDAVIATGSDNSARYFESYFSSYPHIIRRNRNAVAVLSGKETPEQLRGLAEDVFLHFGLGCRNVSKLYVPKGYNLKALIEVFNRYEDLLIHHKYKNNYDYNLTLLLLNKQPFIQGKAILLVPSESLQSRIGTLHYEEWDDAEQLESALSADQNRIQCIVAASGVIPKLDGIPFGSAQTPGLFDYADGVDTMKFLLQLPA